MTPSLPTEEPLVEAVHGAHACRFPDAEDTRPLSELPLGTPALVHSVGGSEDMRRRLLEMGFCNRTRVTAIRRAPWGDPVEFSLRGYNISLRKEEAHCILVVAP